MVALLFENFFGSTVLLKFQYVKSGTWLRGRGEIIFVALFLHPKSFGNEHMWDMIDHYTYERKSIVCAVINNDNRFYKLTQFFSFLSGVGHSISSAIDVALYKNNIFSFIEFNVTSPNEINKFYVVSFYGVFPIISWFLPSLFVASAVRTSPAMH